MTTFVTRVSKFSQILLWSIAGLYLLFSPSLYYRLFPREGKPLEIWAAPPKEKGQIRYSIGDCKFWSDNRVSFEEGETYALWGWAFINRGPETVQADFDRFVVLYDSANAYVFPMQVYRRPAIQDHFKDLGFSDLASAGFYSVISRNALDVGEYRIGLLFKHRQNGTNYYVETDKILVRSPNHLVLERK
jgi:hypothetical protein